MKKLFLILSIISLPFVLFGWGDTIQTVTLKIGEVLITIPVEQTVDSSLLNVAKDLEDTKGDVITIIKGSKGASSIKDWLILLINLGLPFFVTFFTRIIRVVKGFRSLFDNIPTLPIVFGLGLLFSAGIELVESGLTRFDFTDWGAKSFLTVSLAVLIYEGIVKRFFGSNQKRVQ